MCIGFGVYRRYYCACAREETLKDMGELTDITHQIYKVNSADIYWDVLCIDYKWYYASCFTDVTQTHFMVTGYIDCQC